MIDTVEPAAGGFLDIELRTGWRGLVSVSEVASIKQRTEGGCCIYLKNAIRPILVDVPAGDVIEAMEGASDATG